MRRDGTVYGCGSTKHGQLPYLKFSSDDEKLQARNEITQATKLKLPMLQVLSDSRAGDALDDQCRYNVVSEQALLMLLSLYG
jgi:hypothetical protein